jgi:hypothetical protein
MFSDLQLGWMKNGLADHPGDAPFQEKLFMAILIFAVLNEFGILMRSFCCGGGKLNLRE